MTSQEVAMNLSHRDWIRCFDRLGNTLFRHAWYPTVAFGLGQAIVSPEATFLECLATAADLLVVITTAAMFFFAFGWGLAIGGDD
jgi:hypothetical protein